MQTQLRITQLFAASLLCAHLFSAISALPAATPADSRTPAPRPAAAPAAHSFGVASWYGAEHQGRTMANGQKFDRFQLTAASWILPLGAKIRVFNTANGKSVIVTVTDRGPNRRLNRMLDLSEAAAVSLGYAKRGLAVVYYAPA